MTLWTTLLGTTFSIPASLALAVLAARNTTPNAGVYQVARSILSFLRAVPDIVFALVFVTAVGLLLYRFDVNVRSSLVLGLVGAGGIGFLINESIKLFRFDEMLTHILVVLALVLVVDNVSALVRKRIQ